MLRMADDDWDPDLDFPGLDSSAVITDVGVDQFVLCHQVRALCSLCFLFDKMDRFKKRASWVVFSRTDMLIFLLMLRFLYYPCWRVSGKGPADVARHHCVAQRP